MSAVTLSDILGATYSNKEAAVALGHGSFNDFKRNLQRGDEPKDRLVILPRNTGAAGVAGEFRYAHILEFAIHMHVGAVYSRDCAKAVCFALFRRLMHNDTGLKTISSLDREAQDAVMHHGSFDRDEDPYDVGKFVDFATLFLAENAISRDGANRTYALFDTRKILHDNHSLVLANGGAGLAESHDRLLRLVTEGASDERTREMLEDSARCPGVLDLTGALASIDRNLKRVLTARRLMGG